MGAPKAPPPPTPEPVVPVPQPDDPKSLTTERNAAAAAKRREGSTAHLLSTRASGTLGVGDEDNDLYRRRSLTGVA